MPEIDIDTFQVLALLLLVAAVALSALALITVTRLRDELLDRDGLHEPETPTVGGYPSTYTPTQTETFPRTSTPIEPATQAPAWATGGEARPASTSGAGTSAYAAEPEPSAATAYEPVPATGYEPASSGYESTRTSYEPTTPEQSPRAVEAPTPTPTPSTTSTPSADPIPEEQPFERDGRWWYKRGDELLVYDEGSGQWEAAPQGSLGTSTAGPEAAPPSAAAEYASAGTAFGTTTSPKGSPGGAVHDDPGGFWKCTSCGAINGSTAGSCRMCFAAHP